MRKLIAAVFLLCIGVILSAVWFSPLIEIGDVQAYSNNEALGYVAGICYNCDGLYRVDFSGDSEDMYRALDSIGAKQVKSVKLEDMYIVYAYSPRVCCDSQTTSEGDRYNVMAACSFGRVSIGTPVLSGCY